MTARPRHILTDIDGTCVNWISSFEAFMDAKGYEKIPKSDAEYTLGKRYHNITYDLSRTLVREFNESTAIQDLAPLPNAVEYIRKLHEKHQFTFTAITAMGLHPDAHTNRVINLKKHFGDAFSETICVDIGADKYDTLSRWANSKFFWVEDHLAQAISGHKLGLRSILITDATNAHRINNPLERVDDWKGVYSLVTNTYGLSE